MLPPELVDLIIDRAVADGHSLGRYAMVSHTWNHSVRRHSFRSLRIRGVAEYNDFLKCIKEFPERTAYCRSVYLHDGGFHGGKWQAGKLGFAPIVQHFTFITELKIYMVNFKTIDERSLALLMHVEHPPLPNLQKLDLELCSFSDILPLGKFLNTLPALQHVRLSSVNGPWWDEDASAKPYPSSFTFPRLTSLQIQPCFIHDMGITRQHLEAFGSLVTLRIDINSPTTISYSGFDDFLGLLPTLKVLIVGIDVPNFISNQTPPLARITHVLRRITRRTIDTLYIVCGSDPLGWVPHIWAESPEGTAFISEINNRVRELPMFRVKVGCLDTKVGPRRRPHAPFTQAVRTAFQPLVDSGIVTVRSQAGDSVDDIGVW